jgi:ABC-type transporter MlaC component
MNKIKTLIILLTFFVTIQNPIAAEIDDATTYINNLTSRIYEIVSDQKSDINKIRSDIIKEIKDNLNVEWTAKFVLADNWQLISKEEQSEFVKLFEDYLLYNYAPKFQGYKGEKYNITSTQLLAPSKYAANILLKIDSNTEINIVIYFMEENKKYSIVDISAEGISFAATQNLEFSSMITSLGFTKFLAEFAAKVYELKKNSGLTSIEAIKD